MLNEKILEIISENLPNLQVEAFREFIDEATKNKSQITTLEKNIKSLTDIVEDKEKIIQNKNEEIRNFQNLVEQLSKKVALGENLEQRERNLEITILKEQLNNEKQSKQDITSLVKILFQNPSKITSIQDHVVTTSSNTSYDYTTGRCTGSFSSSQVNPITKIITENHNLD